MDGNDAEWQQERQDGRPHQDNSIEPMERLLFQKKTIEQVEDQQRYRHFAFIDKEVHHFS
jgi:hypothetical protein